MIKEATNPPVIDGEEIQPDAIEFVEITLADLNIAESSQWQGKVELCEKLRSLPKDKAIPPELTKEIIEFLADAEDVLNVKADSPLHKSVCRALRATGRRLVELTYNRFWLPMDIYVIALDETEYWNLPAKDMNRCQRIECVYVFDRNEVTHICSFQGSYWLVAAENRAIFKPRISDENQDRIWNDIMGQSCDNDYFDTDSIDKVIEDNKPYTVYHYGNPGVDWDKIEGEDDEAKENTILDSICQGQTTNPFI